jgi:uncharacterized protein YxeA
MKKILTMILALMLVVTVKASILNDYGNSINVANNYIEKFNDYAEYIVSDDNIKFKYDGSTLSNNSSFTKGGFLNLSEFNISKIDGQTYLFNGQQYWTMTESGSNANAITSYAAELKPKTDTYGVRITEYIKYDIEINGSGSYNDPWVFVEIEPEEETPTEPGNDTPTEPGDNSNLTYTYENSTSCPNITTKGYWPSTTANGYKISIGLGQMNKGGYTVTIDSVDISSSSVTINV